MNFEWDEAKRESNLIKHKLDLLRGADLFDGRPVLSYLSPRGDEPRTVTVGLVADLLVAVVWTERRDAVRLISMRRARDAESKRYHAHFG